MKKLLLKTMLLLFALLAGTGMSWADMVSGTTYSTPSISNLPDGWSGADGGGTSYVKLTDSPNYIQTPVFTQNGFTSIVVKARKFGGPSDAQALITVSWYDESTSAETVLGTVAPTSTTLTNYTISSPAKPTGNTSGYIKIQCKGASSSKGSGVSEVTINYTAAGGAPTPTTYTVTYDANGGSGTMTDPDSPYEEDDEVTLLSNTFTAPEGKLWSSWSVTDASDNSVVVTNGKFTMPASNVTVTAQWADDPNAPQYEWVETRLADLTSSDIFVIVGSNYAMTNNNGTSSAPAATAVTIENSRITGNVAENIRWNISGDADNGYTFYPNGSTTTWLYCNTVASSSSNNNMRVGTGDRKLFLPDNNGYFVTNDNYTPRYISLYSNSDWRGYVSTSNGAVALKFYKRQVASTDPSISASDVNIDYNATGGSFDYTINNPVDGGSVSVDFDSDDDWLLTATVDNGTVSFTCEANETNDVRQALIEITYTYNTDVTVTKDVWVTQAAAPVVYSTIPALFAAATGTETDVNVTFNNWVVSGVSTNGKNVFVTDNNGNGFVIYYNSDMSGTFAAGNILSGTAVSCSLKLYNGFAELVNVDANDLTITTGGTVSTANVDLADLAGVNTGALVSYENLTCSVDDSGNTPKYYLSDGTTTIQVYNALYAFEALVAGKTYNITGVYQQYNSTKELMPRSAADIVEVQVQHNDYDLTVTLSSNVSAIFVFDTADDTNPLIVDGAAGTVQVTDGTQIMVSPDVESGYVLESLTVDGVDVTSQMDNSGAYTFTMPTHAISITATAVEYVAPVGTNYTLASSITSGKHYIIVGMNEDDAYAMGEQRTNNRAGVGVTIENETVTVSSADVVEFVIQGPDLNGYYTIYGANTRGYLYASSGNANQLKTREENSDANSQWTISITEGNATITAQGTNTRNLMRFNPNNGSPLFACYASTSTTGTLPAFYVKSDESTPTESKTLNGSGYATYCSQNALDFTNATGGTAWAVTAISGSTITFAQITGAVPAGTGMLLMGDPNATITMPCATGATPLATNLLEGITTATDVAADTYYGLSGDEFVKVNAGTVPAGKALLPATEVGARSLSMVFEGVDGINEIVNGKSVNGTCYDLSGRRVVKPTKGLYIVNGKKIVK